MVQRAALLLWVRSHVEPHGIPVRDFDRSWISGQALWFLAQSLCSYDDDVPSPPPAASVEELATEALQLLASTLDLSGAEKSLDIRELGSGDASADLTQFVLVVHRACGGQKPEQRRRTTRERVGDHPGLTGSQGGEDQLPDSTKSQKKVVVVNASDVRDEEPTTDARTAFRRFWEDLTYTGYLTLPSKLLLAVMGCEALLVIGLTVQRMANPQTDHSEDFSILMLVNICLLALFAINGVLGENIFDLLAFVLVTLGFLGITLYQFFWSPEHTEQIILIIRLVAVCLLAPVNLVLAFFVYQKFGWRMYKKIGSNKNLLAAYRMYSLVCSLIKIDVAFGVNLVLMGGIFLHESPLELAFDVVALAVGVCAWAVIGLIAIRREQALLFIVFMCLSVVTPAYDVYKGQEYWRNQEKAELFLAPIIITGVAALATRFGVVVVAGLCRSNFGTGLLPIFKSERTSTERQRATDFNISISVDESSPLVHSRH